VSAADLLAWLIETSIAVSLLIVLVLLVRKPVARRFGAEAAYLLWLAPALRLIMPSLPVLAPFPTADLSAVGVNVVLAGAPPAPAAAPVSIDLAPLLLMLWAAGALLFLSVQLVCQRRFMRRVLEDAAPPSSELAAEAAVVSGKSGLAAPPRLVVASNEVGPFVCGVFNPVIVLPSNFEAAYSPVERQLALAHEFAHIRRNDLHSTLAALALRALQWPNPVAHAAFAAFRTDQEGACDASVLAAWGSIREARHAYGSAMLKSAAGGLSPPAASLAMFHHLKERLMLMKTETKADRRLGRSLAAALVLFSLGASADYARAGGKTDERRTEVKSSVVSVIEVDGGETIEYDGVAGARRIEIREENGVKTVRVYDDRGKLLTENVYGPGEASPADVIVVRGKDGKTRTIKIAAMVPPAPPAAPPPPDAPLPPDAPDAPAAGAGKADCEARGGVYTESAEASEKGGRRTMTRTAMCMIGDSESGSKADALRAAIAKVESDPSLSAEQRAGILAKLREQLAATEAAGR
jgi:beta-lactamase regulating signal transducer with metallopeptidase domain